MQEMENFSKLPTGPPPALFVSTIGSVLQESRIVNKVGFYGKFPPWWAATGFSQNKIKQNETDPILTWRELRQ